MGWGEEGRDEPAGHVWGAVLRVGQCWQVRGGQRRERKGGRARGEGKAGATLLAMTGELCSGASNVGR